MLMYRFQIKHHSGKLNLAPDCVSRYPAGTPWKSPAQIIDTTVKAAFMLMYGSNPKLKVITWERIVTAVAIDGECWAIAHVIQNSFLNSCNDIPPIVWIFWPMYEELYCLEVVTVKANKILIPQQLHATHQGVNGMLANTRQQLFWLGLNASIRQTRSQCCIYKTTALSQPRKPLMSWADPKFLF